VPSLRSLAQTPIGAKPQCQRSSRWEETVLLLIGSWFFNPTA
jgi:hypothetical protein